MNQILIVDDEKEIIKLLRLYLEKDTATISEAHDGEEAFRLLKERHYDLAIIDIMMPKMNGFELIKNIRKISSIPIIILSAKIQSSDKIFGLEIGADDYITKPFDAMEVVARVNANLRRAYQLTSSQISSLEELTVRNLKLNIAECILYKNEEPIHLTSVEYKLLRIFMESAGRVFTKEQLYDAGWGDGNIVDDNTIRVAISKLREKIGEENIKTIRGLGYRMEK